MYSLINITGLSIGLATCILIITYVISERSYDSFHENSEQIYRVVQTTKSADRDEDQATTPFGLATVLDEEYPGSILNTVRFFDMQQESHTFVNRDERISFREENFYFADSTFFDVFSAELLRGDPKSALKDPLSLVITEDLAKKYFGDQNPVGKSLNYKGIRDMTVTGVMKKWPEESHMKIDLLASFTSLDDIYASSPEYNTSWLWNPIWTYIVIGENTDPKVLEQQLQTLANKYYYAYSGWPSDETVDLELQPVTDIHLHSNRDHEMEVNSSVLYTNILLAVAVFILIIACINFMNLSTARSLERSREVGLRKVMGGHKRQLISQFLGESFFLSVIAIILGCLIVYLSLPFFNELTGKSLTFDLFQNVYTLPALLGLTIFVSFFQDPILLFFFPPLIRYRF